MESRNILSKICLMFGTIILVVGIILKILNETDSGFTHGRWGETGVGTITPNGTLIIGVCVLICAVFQKRSYKIEKTKRNLKKQEEIKEWEKRYKKTESDVKKQEEIKEWRKKYGKIGSH